MCPSAIRRGGAFRSTLPSAVRGMFFQGYDGHCASAAWDTHSRLTAIARRVALVRSLLRIGTSARILPRHDMPSIRRSPGRVEHEGRPAAALVETYSRHAEPSIGTLHV